ncbi:hypothetical protein [Streptomyces sp. NPDC007346]|uniref:hypothetical protein n=1 Tax=Streptomyces sp. NPDC007346 TaxID=3154682 RepID=UPI003453D589
MEETGIPALDVVLMWGGAVTVVAGVIALAWRAVRASVRLAARVDHFMDDWAGEVGRAGVPARPGVMERLATFEDRLTSVEHELYPNDGGSLRDAVDRANARLTRMCPDVDSTDGPGPVPPQSVP